MAGSWVAPAGPIPKKQKYFPLGLDPNGKYFYFILDSYKK